MLILLLCAFLLCVPLLQKKDEPAICLVSHVWGYVVKDSGSAVKGTKPIRIGQNYGVRKLRREPIPTSTPRWFFCSSEIRLPLKPRLSRTVRLLPMKVGIERQWGDYKSPDKRWRNCLKGWSTEALVSASGLVGSEKSLMLKGFVGTEMCKLWLYVRTLSLYYINRVYQQYWVIS